MYKINDVQLCSKLRKIDMNNACTLCILHFYYRMNLLLRKHDFEEIQSLSSWA